MSIKVVQTGDVMTPVEFNERIVDSDGVVHAFNRPLNAIRCAFGVPGSMTYRILSDTTPALVSCVQCMAMEGS